MRKRLATMVGLTASFLGSAGNGNAAQADKPQQSETQTGQVRSEVDLVSVYFTVRNDKKQLVSDLPQDSFHVAEDGQPETIKFFAHHSDVVLNIGVLLDTGTRMDWLLDEEGHAASLFLRHVVRPSDLGFVVSYAASVNTLQLPTSDMKLLQASVRSVPDNCTRASCAPCTANLFGALTKGRPVSFAISAAAASPKPGTELMPVPTAVPPSASR